MGQYFNDFQGETLGSQPANTGYIYTADGGTLSASITNDSGVKRLQLAKPSGQAATELNLQFLRMPTDQQQLRMLVKFRVDSDINLTPTENYPLIFYTNQSGDSGTKTHLAWNVWARGDSNVIRPVLDRRLNQSYVWIAQGAEQTLASGVWYWIRAENIPYGAGQNDRVRIWQDGTAEPSTWAIDFDHSANYTALEQGKWGLGVYTGGHTVSIAQIGLAWAGDPAPSSMPTQYLGDTSGNTISSDSTLTASGDIKKTFQVNAGILDAIEPYNNVSGTGFSSTDTGASATGKIDGTKNFGLMIPVSGIDKFAKIKSAVLKFPLLANYSGVGTMSTNTLYPLQYYFTPGTIGINTSAGGDQNFYLTSGWYGSMIKNGNGWATPYAIPGTSLPADNTWATTGLDVTKQFQAFVSSDGYKGTSSSHAFILSFQGTGTAGNFIQPYTYDYGSTYGAKLEVILETSSNWTIANTYSTTTGPSGSATWSVTGTPSSGFSAVSNWTAGQGSDYIDLKNFGLNIPASATITGVEFSVGASLNYATIDTMYMVYSGGVVGRQLEYTNPQPGFTSDGTFTTYVDTDSGTYIIGDNRDLHGYALTPDIVNNSSFGIRLRGQNTHAGGSLTITDVKVRVWYNNADSYVIQKQSTINSAYVQTGNVFYNPGLGSTLNTIMSHSVTPGFTGTINGIIYYIAGMYQPAQNGKETTPEQSSIGQTFRIGLFANQSNISSWTSPIATQTFVLDTTRYRPFRFTFPNYSVTSGTPVWFGIQALGSASGSSQYYMYIAAQATSGNAATDSDSAHTMWDGTSAWSTSPAYTATTTAYELLQLASSAIPTGTANLVAEADISISPTVNYSATASIVAESDIFVYPTIFASASNTSDATVSATANIGTYASLNDGGDSSMTILGSWVPYVTVTDGGDSSLTATGKLFGTMTDGGDSALAATAYIGVFAAMNNTADSSLAATGTIFGIMTNSSDSTMVTAGSYFPLGTVNDGGDSTLSASANAGFFVSMNNSSDSSLVGVGSKAFFGAIADSGDSTLWPIDAQKTGVGTANFGGDSTANVDSTGVFTTHQAITKTYMYKVYDKNWNYLGIWDDVISEFGYSQEINSAGASITVTLARNADTLVQNYDFLADDTGQAILTDDGNTIAAETKTVNSVGPGTTVDLNLNVKIYEFSSSTGQAADGDLVFTGFVSMYTSKYGDTENTDVSIFSYGADLDNWVLVDSLNNTRVSYLSKDPSVMLKDSLDKFQSAGGLIYYDNTTIENTSTYGFNPTTYTFNLNTELEVIKQCLTMAPTDWYFYADLATNLLHFHPQPIAPSHYFYLGKHLLGLNLEQTMEGIVNDVYFTGGTPTNLTLDRFNDVSGTSIINHVGELGATWVSHPNSTPGTGGAVISNANRLRQTYGGGSTGTEGMWMTTTDYGSSDYEIECDYYIASLLGDISVMGRVDPTTSTHYLARILPASNGTVELYKRVNGTYTLLQSAVLPAGQTLAVGQTRNFKFKMEGAQMTITVDGTSYVDLEDRSIIYGTRAGIRTAADINATDTTGFHIDNFQVRLLSTDDQVPVFRHYTDSTSMSNYRRGLARVQDSRVTLASSADVIAGTQISRSNKPRYRSSVTIPAQTYDIRSIKLGQMVAFRNFGNFIDGIGTTTAPAVKTFYFDGHIAVNDPAGNWTQDTSAFNGDYISGAIEGNANSTATANYLEGIGTNAYSVLGTVTQVRARIYSEAYNTSTLMNANIYSSADELLGTAVGPVTMGWGSYVTLTAPASGWTLAALQALKTRLYNYTTTTTSFGYGVRRVEVEVTELASESPGLQVVRIDYGPDNVTLQLDTLLPSVPKRLEDIKRNLNQSEVADNPDAPS